MNSSDSSSDINNLNFAGIFLYKYVLLIIYIISNIGNLLSFIIFSRKSWKKNVCIFYFKVCLIVDSCYINSTILGIIFINGFQINLQNSNIILCKIYFYACFLFATLTPSILILASIDRLLISSQNIDTRLYSSKRLAYFSISISTSFWILFNLHSLIKVNIQELSPSYFDCSYNLPISYLDFVSYSLGTINIIYCLLMIILCIITFKNVRRIRAIQRGKRIHQIRSMTKKDFQLLRCLYVQDIIFIITSSSVNTYYIYEAMTNNQEQTQLGNVIRDFLNKFFTFLFNASYSSNFFVFILVSKDFRHELKRIIYKIIGKEFRPMRGEEENRQDNVELNVPVVIVSTIELQR